MKKRQIFSLFLAGLMMVGMLSACGKDDNKPSSTTTQSEQKSDNSADSSISATNTTKSDYDKPYKYTFYWNNDWQSLKPWGDDEVSKYLKEKFNAEIEFSKADADPEAKLNIMISSGDLPDALWLDRDQNLLKMAELGLLQSIKPLKEKTPYYDECVPEATQSLLEINGDLYTIPGWARFENASGGNDVWMYNKRIYEKAGSPELKTFEDLYAYAKKVKETVPETEEGASVIPFSTGETKDGIKILAAFYRSFGGAPTALNWYAAVDGKLRVYLRDPAGKAAALEANKWFREGLISETIFSDTPEQITEKFVAGRTGLLYYDQSQNDINNFKRILQESFPDDDYILTDPPFPPANGLSKDKIYADVQQTTAGYGVHITTKAEDPQRIFDLHSYLMTKEAAVIQMYGPKGHLWNELDQNGNPIMEKYDTSLTSTERDQLGLWFWMMPGHAENVDQTKFAVNEAAPEELKSWVINNQANILTPLMSVSDEYFGLKDTIDGQSDLGIKRALCEDQIKAQLPKIIMASSAEEAEKVYNELISFLDKNSMQEIEETYDKKYQENCKIQGGSRFTK